MLRDDRRSDLKAKYEFRERKERRNTLRYYLFPFIKFFKYLIFIDYCLKGCMEGGFLKTTITGRVKSGCLFHFVLSPNQGSQLRLG
jgi:hypothetical protein